MVADTLRAEGITTISKLAELTAGDEPEQWSNGSFQDAIAAARCHRTGDVMVRRSASTPIARRRRRGRRRHGELRRGWRLPVGHAADRPDRPGSSGPLPALRDVAAVAEYDRGTVLRGLWNWLHEEMAAARAQGKTFAAYRYLEQAENWWLRGSAERFAGMPGIPSLAEVNEFIRSPQWVDVYAAVSANSSAPRARASSGLRRSPAFPGGTGGERRRVDGLVLAAVGLTGAQPDPDQRTRLLQYNEDDVWATKVLREWMDGDAVRTCRRWPTCWPKRSFVQGELYV